MKRSNADRPVWMRLLGLYYDEPIREAHCTYETEHWICVDGLLWEVDSGYPDPTGGWQYTRGGDFTCPRCHPADQTEKWFAEAYQAALRGAPVFDRKPPPHRWRAFRQQLKAFCAFIWDQCPRWRR